MVTPSAENIYHKTPLTARDFERTIHAFSIDNAVCSFAVASYYFSKIHGRSLPMYCGISAPLIVCICVRTVTKTIRKDTTHINGYGVLTDSF